jgi:hypothetical protein
MIVLDTNVVSEAMNPESSGAAVRLRGGASLRRVGRRGQERWASLPDARRLCRGCCSIARLHRCITRYVALPSGRCDRHQPLGRRLAQAFDRLAHRCFDTTTGSPGVARGGHRHLRPSARGFRIQPGDCGRVRRGAGALSRSGTHHDLGARLPRQHHRDPRSVIRPYVG